MHKHKLVESQRYMWLFLRVWIPFKGPKIGKIAAEAFFMATLCLILSLSQSLNLFWFCPVAWILAKF